MYSLERASVQGSPLGFLPEVTCVRGTVSSRVTITNGTLYLYYGRIVLWLDDFMRVCSRKEAPAFTEAKPY